MVASTTGTWWRPLRPEESRVQFGAIRDKLDLTVQKFDQSLRRILGEAREEVIRAAIGIKNSRDWKELRKLTVDGSMGDYHRAIKDHLNNIYNFGKAEAAAGYGVATPPTSAAFILWLESQSQILTELHREVLDSRIRRTVLGAPNVGRAELGIRRVFDEFADSELEKGGDLLAVISIQAAREDVNRLDEVDLVSLTWSAILDDRVCPICLELDGVTWRIGDPSIIHPPIHFRCRCLLVGTMVDAVYKPAITGLPPGFQLPPANQRFMETLGGYR